MFNYTEIKKTERLLIRPLTMEDNLIWKSFLEDAYSTKYFPDFMRENAKNQSSIWIKKQLERYKNNRFGLMALIEKSTGTFVGQCGLLTQQVDDIQEIEIGYHLLSKHQGKGFASEAAQFFKSFAFQNNLSDSLISIIHKDNIPSQKVAINNGMNSSKALHYHGIDVFIYRVSK